MASGPRLHLCTYCYTPVPEFPRIKCIVCLDFTLCPDCFEAKLELAGHLNTHPVRVILEGAVQPLPARGHLDRLWCREDHLLLLEALLSAGLGSWARIANTMGRGPEASDIPQLMFELMHCQQNPLDPRWISPVDCCPTHHGRIASEIPADAHIGMKHKSQKNEKQKLLLYSFARAEFLEECPMERAEDVVRALLESFTAPRRRSSFTIMADAVDRAIREFGREPSHVTAEDLLRSSATASQAAAAAADRANSAEGLALDLHLSASLLAVGTYLRQLDRRRERQTFLTNWGMLRWNEYIEHYRRIPPEERVAADALRPLARFCGSRAAFRAFIAERVAVERLKGEIVKARERARQLGGTTSTKGGALAGTAPQSAPGTGRDARREAAADAIVRLEGGAYLSPAEVDVCAMTKLTPSGMIASKLAGALGVRSGQVPSVPTAPMSIKRSRSDNKAGSTRSGTVKRTA